LRVAAEATGVRPAAKASPTTGATRRASRRDIMK